MRHNAYSSYSESTGWEGNLTTLEPGKGYMYLNRSNTPKTLVYPE